MEHPGPYIDSRISAVAAEFSLGEADSLGTEESDHCNGFRGRSSLPGQLLIVGLLRPGGACPLTLG